MNKTAIVVDVTNTNISERVKQTKTNCPGYRKSEHCLVYKEDHQTTVELTVGIDSLTIFRNGENKTRIVLNKAGECTACTSCEYGDFYFDVSLEKLLISNKMISAQYILMQSGQMVNQIHIRWIIKEEQA